ncbi:MAG: flagellar hook-associated protein FlgK, partial [Proteobacteria bacterium]|nr:flagellar hook-associated protein FlgK [Pseudomonadota bacterium]
IAVSLSDPGALGGDDYQLAWQGGSYVLTRMSDGSTVATTGAGTAASPLLAGGLSIVISGAPANGDRFLIQPASAAAGSISVVQGDGSKIAAASAVIGSAGNTNTGSGRIGPASVVDPANANLFTPASIAFTSATTYSINGSGSFAYTPGADITANGWKVQISGTPAAGDTFAVSRNISGKGDNTNALALAALQNQNVLGSGAVSISGALGSLVTQVGAIAQQTTTAQSAQTAVNNSALQAVQSRSGVNLDEEAAALLQWQQAYQAAAQALKIGSSLFDTLIAAVRAG